MKTSISRLGHENYQRELLSPRDTHHTPSNFVKLRCSEPQIGVDGVRSAHTVLKEFPNGGSLEDYYFYTRPPSSAAELYEFWGSLFKISEAISEVHNGYTARSIFNYMPRFPLHLTPYKILVFGANIDSAYSCTFKLADFARTHFATPAFNREKSKVAHLAIGNYSEYHMCIRLHRLRHKKVHQKIDVDICSKKGICGHLDVYTVKRLFGQS